MMSELDVSVFANVDLDIYSKEDLRPLVDGFGSQVIELWVGKVGKTHEAHLELGWNKRQNPTSIILGFCRLIESLKPRARNLWNSASKKSFDIGIHAPARDHHYWSAVSPQAVRAAADVGAQIAITVYGPMKPTKAAKGKVRNISSP